MVFKPHNPGCCFSCDCPFCAGGVPIELEVTLAGIANAPTLCTDCNLFNATFILAFGELGGSGCCWRYSFPGGAPCDATKLEACLQSNISLGYQLLVSLQQDGVWSMTWTASLGFSKPDCTAWSSLDVPRPIATFNDPCDFSSSTCLVTAL